MMQLERQALRAVKGRAPSLSSESWRGVVERTIA